MQGHEGPNPSERVPGVNYRVRPCDQTIKTRMIKGVRTGNAKM